MGVDLAGIACLVTGSSRSLTLGADGTVGAGTFTLLDASGASVVTGTVTAGSCTVTLGGAVAVGGRYSLVWTVTVDGTSRRLIQPALVAYSDFALPPAVAAVVPQLTGLTAPPAGWGETVASAWYRVLLTCGNGGPRCVAPIKCWLAQQPWLSSASTLPPRKPAS